MINGIVALVIKENDEHHGKIGILEAHDWRESGNYFVSFGDGRLHEYCDGWEKGGPEAEALIFEMPEMKEELLKEYAKTNNLDLKKARKKLSKEYKRLFGKEL